MIPVIVRCRIPQLLKRIGKDQVWLAGRLNMPKQQINHYVNMRSIPSLKIAKRIADTLDVTIDELHEWEWREE